MHVKHNLRDLRFQMKAYAISAYIIPTSDPHINEYLPEHWKIRQWVTGFTGSAGTFVITSKKAALWVDSRYYLQAEKELYGSGIELCRIGMEGTPSIDRWIADNCSKKAIVAFDGLTFPVSTAGNLIKQLKKNKFTILTHVDLVSAVWKNRPKLSNNKAFTHELIYSGASAAEKLEIIRSKLLEKGATGYLICALDEVCWAFNIRGNDIPYNPVVLSYAYINHQRAILFIDFEKINQELINKLKTQGIDVKPYCKMEKLIKNLKRREVIYLDPAKTNYHMYSLIPKKVEKVEGVGIITELKSRKNPVELEGFRQSMIQDGLAMVEFWFWLEQNIGKIKITETFVCEKLKEFRSTKNGYVSEGFATITGYADHGAIVHYMPTAESEYEIKPKSFLLFDSGGQYLTGTTDVTRTVHLGKPTNAEKSDFTLVLKGMIQLSNIRYPVGTRGSQLDTMARMAMWKYHINYGHGTGHGVGSFLNVHEGPMQIRPDNYLPIEAGVVMSNEPGIYREGKYGIRIENMITCVIDEESEFGKFLSFETLTLCPIDKKPIDIDLMTEEEKQWLNDYHEMVYAKLSPHLKGDIKRWLKDKTTKI